MAESSLALRNQEEAQALFGQKDQHLKKIEEALHVTVVVRRDDVKVSGNDKNVESALNLFHELLEMIRTGSEIKPDVLNMAIKSSVKGEHLEWQKSYQDKIEVAAKKKTIVPRTQTQKTYVEAMRQNDMVFGIGPAGTGKTFLAMAIAVESLTKGDVSRIILTRPAVEAGERLGYLPGDLSEKINPYLRPLYDALYEMMDMDMVRRYLDRGIIEVAPLAYMRGRTLNDAFVILDEAQNTTSEQMKMFLTRLGFDSKAVITGDITQIDLPGDRVSGLVEAKKVLSNVEKIKFIEFEKQDVVRHDLVQKIIVAYEEANIQHRNR